MSNWIKACLISFWPILGWGIDYYDNFYIPERNLRNIPTEKINRTTFYSTKGMVTLPGSFIPNYNLGLGFRHQKGKYGVDFNVNFENCLIFINAQAVGKVGFLQYLSPKIDGNQTYFAQGIAYTYGKRILKYEMFQSVGINLTLGRELPLNWQERKFYQITVELPLFIQMNERSWTSLVHSSLARIPSIQILFGRSF